MNESSISQLYLKDTAFQDLMQKRIFNVLLVATPYDAFMMEDDGRVEEQIYNEYTALNLSSPPRVTRVANCEEALLLMREKHFDLVIAMPGLDISETFTGAREIKKEHADVPFVVLTPFSREVSRRLQGEDLSCVDYVFSWLGNVDLLLAIVKLLEDRWNAENDILQVGVQAIMLVEDSVRFYSSILPTLYKFLLRQSRTFSTEALNQHEQMMRMRGRPKVILARTYEEATELYKKYGDQMLGVISDVSFMREGKKDSAAGLRLASEIRRQDPYKPIIIESSEVENREKVKAFSGHFLDKNSRKLPVDLGDAIMKYFGFGDFVIRNPEDGAEIMRICNLNELQRCIFDIPDKSLHYHASNNDISRWLYSRALFPIASVIQSHRFVDIAEAPAVKQLFFDLIVKYRKMKNRGVVAEFKKDRFDHYSNFARIGEGSLGGKGRGLAFIDSIIKNNPVCDDFHGVTISIPRSVVICTDIFDEFMEQNNLYPIALSQLPDAEILAAFLKARLPERVREDLRAMFDVANRPMAVRSSSLLEDSHYQPFAGIYSTYMIPRLDNHEEMLTLMCSAVKSVYASVFYADSKAYMMATSNVIDQEKMAVIIQEVVGEEHGEYYFPTISGVGRSLNYYPLEGEKADDGIVEVATGLGKYIVDGGTSLRFSPKHPHHVLQTSTTEMARRSTQRVLYALHTDKESCRDFSVDDGFNIARVNVQTIAKTGALRYVTSTYDVGTDTLYDDGMREGGFKLVTFANVLKHDVFPLAQTTDFMLTQGQAAMCRPVEIEFAATINPNAQEKHRGHIYWLQIRPIVDRKEMLDEEVMSSAPEDAILYSSHVLGHGQMDGLRSVVLVKKEAFGIANNSQIASEIEKINSNFTSREENYVLIGPGRWGSSDPALGIPVKWSGISAAKIIAEIPLDGRHIEPSQGTHFFHNLTSQGVGYFTIAPSDVVDLTYLNAQPAAYESEWLKVVTFDEAMPVAINGRKSRGVVLKPIKE